MALPTTGPISFSLIRSQFEGPVGQTMSFSSYYANAIQKYTAGIAGIPNTGAPLNIGVFRGKQRLPALFFNTTTFSQSQYAALYQGDVMNIPLNEFTSGGSGSYTFAVANQSPTSSVYSFSVSGNNLVVTSFINPTLSTANLEVNYQLLITDTVTSKTLYTIANKLYVLRYAPITFTLYTIDMSPYSSASYSLLPYTSGGTGGYRYEILSLAINGWYFGVSPDGTTLQVTSGSAASTLYLRIKDSIGRYIDVTVNLGVYYGNN